MIGKELPYKRLAERTGPARNQNGLSVQAGPGSVGFNFKLLPKLHRLTSEIHLKPFHWLSATHLMSSS